MIQIHYSPFKIHYISIDPNHLAVPIAKTTTEASTTCRRVDLNSLKQDQKMKEDQLEEPSTIKMYLQSQFQ